MTPFQIARTEAQRWTREFYRESTRKQRGTVRFIGTAVGVMVIYVVFIGWIL